MNQSKHTSKSDIPVLLLLFAFAFGILYICTASSPRYAINPWNDANAFLSMGKAMSSRITIYKDIFEQKGPLLYLIHAIASRISATSFTGVYVMQSLALGTTAFAAYKISSLYISTGFSIISAVLTCFVTVNSGCYYYGDSAEEFCLPLLMISLYFFCVYFRDTKKNTLCKFIYFFVGFLAGCVAMIKFTVIGFWFAWAAYISLYTWIAKKDFKTAAANALIFIIGMAAAIIPWIAYFAFKGALNDFINVYFVINATAYPKVENLGIAARLLKPIYTFATNLAVAPVLFSLGILGILLFAVTNIFAEKKFFSRLSVPFVCGLGIYIIFFGIRYYNYYVLPLSAFMIFSFTALGALAEKVPAIKKKKLVPVFLCIATIISTVVGSNYINLSSKYVARSNEKTVQSDVAEYINEHNPNGKLLNYGVLDAGFYLAANQVPQFRHFEAQNLIYDKFPENTDEQNRYIDDNEADFVVFTGGAGITAEDLYRSNKSLDSDYNLVMTEYYSIRSSGYKAKELKRVCYLFELKED